MKSFSSEFLQLMCFYEAVKSRSEINWEKFLPVKQVRAPRVRVQDHKPEPLFNNGEGETNLRPADGCFISELRRSSLPPSETAPLSSVYLHRCWSQTSVGRVILQKQKLPLRSQFGVRV